MIERDFEKFLRGLVATEFKNNRLAQVLNQYWGTNRINTDPKQVFDALIPLVRANIARKDQYPQIKQSSSSDVDEKPPTLEKTDFRISSILLSSIRGIEDKQDELPFGINLMSDSGVPLNAIIVGNNGTGKTSIFSAVEYIYTEEISEAILRDYKGDGKKAKYPHYLMRVNSKNDPYGEIQIIDGDIYDLSSKIADIKGLKSQAFPQSNFISEYDVQKYASKDVSGKDDDFHNHIAELLGFKDYIYFLEYIGILKNRKRIKDKKDYTSNREDKRKHTKNIGEWESELRKLRHQLREPDSNFVLEQNQKFLEKLRERQNEQFENISVDEVKEKTGNYVDAYTRFKSMQSEVIDEEKIRFLQLGRKLIEKEGDCPFCSHSELGVEAIKKSVESKLVQSEKIVEINESLSEIYEDVLGVLKSFIFTLDRYKTLIDDDIEVLSSISMMGEFIQSEKQLLKNSAFGELRDLVDELDWFERKSSFDSLARDRLHEFIIERGGFFFKNQLIEHIKQFNTDREGKIKKVILALQKKTGDLDAVQSLEVVKFRIKEFENKIEESKKEIQRLEQEEPGLRQNREAYERIKEDVVPLLNRLNEEIQKILAGTIEPLKDTMEKTLESFVKKDEVEIKIYLKPIDEENSDSEKKRLVIELVNKEKGILTEPKKYFNTFRYKVFCGTIAIALALASRKNSGVNLPLILDDEFFASDIINRSEFESYFRNIVYMYRKITPELPFQFILFTHDELIFESAREAIENVWEDIQKLNTEKDETTIEDIHDFWKSALVNKTKFARLFPSTDREKSPRELKNGKKYWDLLFEFKT